MTSGRTLRRGFWRLAFLLWATGAVLLLWWDPEPLGSPLADVCVPQESPPYAECLVAAPGRPSGVADRLLAALRRAPAAAVDPGRTVPRWKTTRHRAALRTATIRQAWWLAIVWVPFYLLVWAFAGFRPA